LIERFDKGKSRYVFMGASQDENVSGIPLGEYSGIFYCP